MKGSATLALINTVRDRCKTCYQCVRECPARAIRIVEGQADVIPERCIGCGNCVRVCNQHAKIAVSAADEVMALLRSPHRTAAIVAPSFPAEFAEIDASVLVGMLRSLGFDMVCEVGYGADLVALEYRRLLDRNDGRRYIATTCPAIVCFVEKYYPDLVPALAPVISPMVAAARALRQDHGDALHTVFIGPCLAKRREALSEELQGEVTQAITFAELRTLFDLASLTPVQIVPSDFDPPQAHMGAVFAVKRGLLKTAAIDEDLITNDVISAGGTYQFEEAIREFAAEGMTPRLLEVLCCNGCIMGAGMTTEASMLTRRIRVAQFVKQRLRDLDCSQWKDSIDRFSALDMSRRFLAQDQRMPMPSRGQLAEILQRMGKTKPEDELNCGACGYATCDEHATAVYMGLAENEMCLPYAIEQLHTTVDELNLSNQELASAQEALVQAEKLASMGQLAAGIAHEINNPLGVVLMYAHLLLEDAADNELREDLRMIAEEADRCKSIVSGLLDFARQNRVIRTPVDVNDLVVKTLRALPPPDGIEVRTECHLEDPIAELDKDQFIQVLSNLITNAYTAMPEGGTVTASLEGDSDSISLRLSDTGVGVPAENLEKIFHPFFTTKQIGKGTGLGLAVTYGIVKMHRGTIHCESNADPAAGPTGTTFTVTMPRQGE